MVLVLKTGQRVQKRFPRTAMLLALCFLAEGGEALTLNDMRSFDHYIEGTQYLLK